MVTERFIRGVEPFKKRGKEDRDLNKVLGSVSHFKTEPRRKLLSDDNEGEGGVLSESGMETTEPAKKKKKSPSIEKNLSFT